MNMATNAREAMPNGGKLVLETSNLELDESAAKKAGREAGCLRDAGRERHGFGHGRRNPLALVRTFFHHQGAGKGSGLGLSMVYGTVKQSEGNITVYSQVNCGTIFEIYLPRVEPATEVPLPRRAGGLQRIGNHAAGG